MTDSPNKNVLMVACMKDEGPFILEWVAHHIAVGFSQFIVVSNHCTDGTDKILNRLDELNIIRHLPNPAVLFSDKRNYQRVALRYAHLQKEFHSAKWVMTIDTDEFVNIRCGNGYIYNLLELAGDVDAISLNTVNFGSSGIQELKDAPITQQFTLRHNFEEDKGAKHPKLFSIKTISRNDKSLFKRLAAHTPFIKKEKIHHIKWCDGSGKRVSNRFMEELRSVYWTDSGTHSLGYINHYAVKSLDAFLLQVVRGDAMSEKFSRDEGYWALNNRNEIIDKSIERYSSQTLDIIRELKNDPILGDLHRKTVEYSQKRAKWLLSRKEIKALIKKIERIEDRMAATT